MRAGFGVCVGHGSTASTETINDHPETTEGCTYRRLYCRPVRIDSSIRTHHRDTRHCRRTLRSLGHRQRPDHHGTSAPTDDTDSEIRTSTTMANSSCYKSGSLDNRSCSGTEHDDRRLIQTTKCTSRHSSGMILTASFSVVIVVELLLAVASTRSIFHARADHVRLTVGVLRTHGIEIADCMAKDSCDVRQWTSTYRTDLARNRTSEDIDTCPGLTNPSDGR